ncbi:MAG: hypothetical protein HPY85_03660 [Anaerolineae bacterium]|nr:hypothetical protein [Anaerolineae bacterium]
MEAFLDKNRNQIIGYGLWLITSIFSFIALNALVTMITRLFTYFWVGIEVPKLLLFLRQFAILPVGLTVLALVRYGYDVVAKNAVSRPDRIWHFYTRILALEFAVLYMAAKI